MHGQHSRHFRRCARCLLRLLSRMQQLDGNPFSRLTDDTIYQIVTNVNSMPTIEWFGSFTDDSGEEQELKEILN